ncbi:MAG: aminoacyl-tRNA hydrolase [Anaerolineales bacterium]|nr:aminoacyl-tRNA hydrolase [Anaerolineales bacterium]
MMESKTYLLIGLGNPGREYKDTRHNIGFMALDVLAEKIGARGMKVQSKAIITSALYNERKLILAKPQTYMNLSGQSVQGLLHFYKIPVENLLVAHDDLDLPFGAIRIRAGGGAGGQRGIANTIERLGTQDFPRLRLGIGRPPGRMEAKDYVLQNFSKDEQKNLQAFLSRAADAALEFALNGLNAAMNQFNGEMREP